MKFREKEIMSFIFLIDRNQTAESNMWDKLREKVQMHKRTSLSESKI